MASRFANNDAQRAIKRMNGDLNITREQKDRIVNIATAHLAAGNSGDFTTALTAVSRADTLNDVQEQVDRMEERLLKSIEASKGKTVETEDTSDIFELMRKIDERLSVIEGERLSK